MIGFGLTLILLSAQSNWDEFFVPGVSSGYFKVWGFHDFSNAGYEHQDVAVGPGTFVEHILSPWTKKNYSTEYDNLNN